MINPVNKQGNVVNEEGQVLAGATITVTLVSNGSLVSLYSDLNDTPLSNPFPTDSGGAFEFYCESALVNITATKDGFTRTWSNEFLNSETPKETILNQGNLYTGGNSYEASQNFQQTINIKDISFANGNGGFAETVAANNFGLVLQIDGNKGLNFFDLSNDNSGTSTTRATTEAGCEARITKRFGDDLGTAAYKDLTSPSANIWDDGNLTLYSWIGLDNTPLGVGTAVSSTRVDFYFYSNWVSLPTSKSGSGTFAVRLPSGTVIDSAITIADLNLSSSSSNRVARLSYTAGSSIFTTGTTYELRTDEDNAEIIIN